MTFTLPKKTRILWQLRIFVVVAVLCVALVVFCHFSLWVFLPTLIVVAIGSVFIFYYIPLYFKNYTIFIDDGCICINKGVFIKTMCMVPYCRLAVIKSFATPIISALKLKTVMLKVARGWLFIPEIDCKNVETLLKAIYDK